MRLKAVLICLASGTAAGMVACGDDGGANKLPDAPPGSDSAMPDTPDPLTPARLTITRDGSGVEGVDVYFQNADNSLVAKVATDVNGVAEATVMPGAYVTVVNPFVVALGIRSDDLQTFAGVQPGDQLRLSQDNGRETLTNINVVVNQDPNGSQYKLWATCMVFFQKSSASSPFYLAVGSGSTDRPAGSPDLLNCGTKTDMLIESENGSGSGVGWIFKDDVPVAAAANIDITDAYTATPTVTLEYTNVPSNVFSIYAQNILATSDGQLWQEELNLGSGATSISYERPAPATSTQVFLTSLSTSGSTSNQLVDWMPIATAPTLSLANGLLRQVTAPEYNIATATASWTEEASGEAPDLAIARVTAFRETPNPMAWTWKLAGPVTGPSLPYPTLPTEIAQYNLISGDSAQIYDLTLAKVPGGYNAVRPIVLSQNLAGFFAGTSGRVLVQRYFD